MDEIVKGQKKPHIKNLFGDFLEVMKFLEKYDVYL